MLLLLLVASAAMACKDLMADCELHLDKCGNWYIQTYQCPLSCGTCEEQDDPLTPDWVVVAPDIPETTTTRAAPTTTSSTTTTTTTQPQISCADNPCNSQGVSSCRDLTEAPFYQCECFANYEGYRCEIENCRCGNGGICSYCSTERCFCSCPPGWTGAYCDVRVQEEATTKLPTTTTTRTPYRTSARSPYPDYDGAGDSDNSDDSELMTYIYEYVTYDSADKRGEEKPVQEKKKQARNPLSFYFWYKMLSKLQG